MKLVLELGLGVSDVGDAGGSAVVGVSDENGGEEYDEVAAE